MANAFLQKMMNFDQHHTDQVEKDSGSTVGRSGPTEVAQLTSLNP
jgi:hypothetical protein